MRWVKWRAMTARPCLRGELAAAALRDLFLLTRVVQHLLARGGGLLGHGHGHRARVVGVLHRVRLHPGAYTPPLFSST